MSCSFWPVFTSYVATNEWLSLAFESIPIFLAFVACTVYHVGKLLEHNAPEGTTPLWIQQREAIQKQRIPEGQNALVAQVMGNVDSR